jgi:hypothetical protein
MTSRSRTGSRSGSSALDEPGDVGDGEAHVAGLDDPEVGGERGERVVGDLGPRRRHRRDEAGLAGTRVADERHVRHGLQLEDDLSRLAGLAEQGEAGGLAPRAGQGGVAETAAPARGDDEAGAVPEQVGQDRAVGAADDGAVGDAELDVGAVGAVLVPALADAAALGGPVG